MMRLRTVALAAVAATSLVLSACGSSSQVLDDAGGSGDAAVSDTGAAFDSDTAGDTDSAAPDETTDGATGETETGDSGSSEPESVIIGSANFTESELLAEIYAAALKAAGVDVTTKLDIGSREVYLQALEEGSVTVFPEYTGGLLAYYDSSSTSHSPDEVYADLQAALPADLTALDYSPAQDQDSVTVTSETAAKYNLKSIGDLAPVAGNMTLGGSPEWQTRADGPEGLKKVYGVEFGDYKVLDPGGPLSVKGLKNGLVDATDIFTTDPAIEDNDFVVLEDPENLFLAQNVVPLLSAAAATPTVTDTLNTVSAALTTEALTSMLKEISDTKADPADVAQAWVTDNGLG